MLAKKKGKKKLPLAILQGSISISPAKFCSHLHRSRCHHTDCCSERPSKVPPPWRKAGSQLLGSGLWDRNSLLSAPGDGNSERLARRSSRHTQDNTGLPPGGEVCHAGWWCVHAQTGPEWDGDAEGQPYLGIRKYHTGGQLHQWYNSCV